MPGIVRIEIEGAHTMGRRYELSKKHEPFANNIYNHIFDLADGCETITGTREDVIGRADWQEGIDLTLYDKDGAKLATVQEKFMEYKGFETLTFEETKQSGKPGAWYTCSAQLYFVGYLDPVKDGFCSWMIIDFVEFRMLNNKGLINWGQNVNNKEGRTNAFRYVRFDNVPESCIYKKKLLPKLQLELPF
jgi:hypothetical protein